MRNHRGGQEEEYRGPTRNRHVVLLGGSPVEEPFVEIVDEIGSAPIELGADRGHVGRGEARHHEAAPGRREQIYERLNVSRFMIIRDANRACNTGWVEENRAKSRDDPRPRPDGVVRNVEKECREDAITLGLGGEDSLRDVPAAAGLSTWIPGSPPLN